MIIVIEKVIEEAIALNRICAKRNSQKTGSDITRDICVKFQIAYKGIFLWEGMSLKSSYISNIDGWKYIGEFVGKEPCQLFFNPCDENAVYDILNGDALNDLLAETTQFEFYVANEELSYVICFNHHDCLFGMGSAQKWIQDMRQGDG